MLSPEFYFVFRGKDSRDMTRDELLEVIEHMIGERNRQPTAQPSATGRSYRCECGAVLHVER